MELFKLFGSIFIDSDEADKAMKKTGESAEGLMSKVGKGVGAVAGAGVAIASTAVAATSALIDQAKEASKATDEIDKMSQKIGISAEGYQEWSYIMGQNGMDISKMQTGVKTLSTLMDKASNGNKTAIDTFNRLGVSITNADGSMKSAEQMMNESITALAGMEEGAERTSLAVSLFGESGTEMMPMLNQGSAAIEELRDRAHDLGLVMSEETVSSGVEFGDLMDDVTQSLQMLVTNLGSSLFPILNDVLNIIIEYLPNIQSMFQDLAPIAEELLNAVIPPLMEMAQAILPPLMDLVQQLAPFLADIASAVLPIITDLLKMLIPPLVQIVEDLLPILQPILDVVMKLLQSLLPILQPILDIVMAILDPLLQIVGELLGPLIELLSQHLMIVLDELAPVLEFLADCIEIRLKAAFDAIMPVIENVKGILQGLIDFIAGVFTGDWERAWSGVSKIFENIFKGLVNLVKAPMNAIIGGINGVFAKIGTIVIPDWVPGIGGNTFSLPQLPLLAKGGNVQEEGTVVVGEKGPEILDLPSGARVTPLNANADHATLNGLTKEDITSAFVSALQTVGLELTLSANTDSIFDDIVEKNIVYKRRHDGEGAFA